MSCFARRRAHILAEPMLRRAPLFLLSLSLGCLARSSAPSEEEPPIEEVLFLRDVRPIFADACHSCHGASLAEANLRLDKREDVLGSRRGAPIVVPFSPEES